MDRFDEKCNKLPVSETRELERLKHDLQARELDLEIHCQAMQETLAELEESRSRYAELYDYAPIGYVMFDARGCIREINLTGATMLGTERSRLIGAPMSVFLLSDSYKLFFDHLRSCRLTGKKVITELRLAPRNANPIHVQITSMPLPGPEGSESHYRSVISDITERKNLEQEMFRMDRLNLIGEMAAGIAHEIRNPMTTVRGFLQTFMLRQEFKSVRSQLDLMVEELDRANSIISEYLSLAKHKPVNKALQNLNEIVNSLLPLMESDALLHKKSLATELSPDLPALLLDAQEMRQLLLNLVRNGLEAMEPGGHLTIKTVARGNEVLLLIQDQGIGIPAEILAKLGTPFTTTKEGGTGLGLPICYSIAQRHNAQIEIKTQDSGTTFVVKFPLPQRNLE